MANNTANALKDKSRDFERTAQRQLDNGSSTISDLKEAAHEVGSQVRHFIDDGRAQFDNARDRTEDAIKSHPFRSAAVAFAGGMILAALLRR